MPDQKISQLTAIVTVDNSADVLPIVDISANTTKKVTPTQLKTALALDNVNNTSDANKPVSTAQQDALNAKVNSNAAITPGTAAKITFDAKGLVTSGNSLDETDLPTGINANKIGTGVVSTTEFEYLNGVTSAIQTQIDNKQASLVSGTNIKTVNLTSLVGSGNVAVQETLVSGTNIKTINSTSLLGSGNITIAANPSGVAGAIQFSNGSAFASDATNLFWDDTNNRLGVGTNAPSATGHFKGSGSTSATTSLLVQNSAGSNLLRITDNGVTKIGGLGTYGKLEFGRPANDDSIGTIEVTNPSQHFQFTETVGNGFRFLDGYGKVPMFLANGKASVNKNAIADASAQFEVVSTTGGILFPRMTTTQKNAIATPAAGLVVYDSTTNKLQCYNGSTWNDLF